MSCILKSCCDACAVYEAGRELSHKIELSERQVLTMQVARLEAEVARLMGLGETNDT